jgi:uncharacterized protein (TIGR03085 family)
VSLAVDERAAICDEFERAGPDRPTLCEGWNSRDLLAHLLVRERQPWAAPGILISAFAPITENAMAGYAGTAWPNMIDELRKGPPPWSPYRIGKVDEVGNGAEYFVHHEDLRRARPGWQPRRLDQRDESRLWALLRPFGMLLVRSAGVPVTLRRSDTGATAVLRRGADPVVLTGLPSELALRLFGRAQVHGVGLAGPAGRVAAFREADLSF